MKLSLVVLRCADLRSCKEFYEKLGLSFVQEQHGCGPIHYSANLDDVVLELYPEKHQDRIDNTRLGFHFDEVRNIVEQFTVIHTRDGPRGPVYIIADPDGRKIELD